MTPTQRKAMEQALEALELCYEGKARLSTAPDAITALRAALAEPVEREPNIPGLAADPSAFVRWASKAGYDMTSHPLHFLFLNEKTAAARAGWKAACDFYTATQPKAAEQEPVAWMCSNTELMHKGYQRFSATSGGDWNIPVYTAPQHAKQPLTLWTEAQHERAYRNSPELHKDVKSLAAFKRVAKEIAAMYGIGETK